MAGSKKFDERQALNPGHLYHDPKLDHRPVFHYFHSKASCTSTLWSLVRPMNTMQCFEAGQLEKDTRAVRSVYSKLSLSQVGKVNKTSYH